MRDGSFASELLWYLSKGMTLQHQRLEYITNAIKHTQRETPVYFKRTHGTRSVDQPLFNDGLGQLRV